MERTVRCWAVYALTASFTQFATPRCRACDYAKATIVGMREVDAGVPDNRLAGQPLNGALDIAVWLIHSDREPTCQPRRVRWN
jgi:hypothetical protein